MPRSQPRSWSRQIQSLFAAGTLSGLSDRELLDRFLARGDTVAEMAFAVLVERHGPMVLGVCRRILGDPHDAEDAFQATFLVLVKRAHSVRVDGSLGAGCSAPRPGWPRCQVRGPAPARPRTFGVRAYRGHGAGRDNHGRRARRAALDRRRGTGQAPSRIPLRAGDVRPGRRQHTKRPPGASACRSEPSRAGWRGPVQDCTAASPGAA